MVYGLKGKDLNKEQSRRGLLYVPDHSKNPLLSFHFFVQSHSEVLLLIQLDGKL